MTRDDLITLLETGLPALPMLRAAWLGGSDATGRADDRSDVDCVVVAATGEIEAAFAAIERLLESASPIAHRYRMPTPAWHGHEQAFYRLARTGPDALVDLLVQDVAAPPESRFLEPERHGTPRALFDREGILDAAPALDRPAHRARVAARLEDLRARVPIFAGFARKELARGRLIDAMQFYRGMLLIPLVELLRIRHCPDRFDFGLRYLERDLPPERCAAIERLSFAADAAALAARIEETEALVAVVLDELRTAPPDSRDP